MASLTILGSGGSMGVPAIGNQWGACDPAETRNHRLRPSALVRSDTTTIVIDTGPDFRVQMNRAGIDKLDAVLYTHAHGDHINGLEELRVLKTKEQGLIPLFANQEAQATIKSRFPNMFDTEDKTGIYPLTVEFQGWHSQDTEKQHKIGDIDFTLVPLLHNDLNPFGYRFGDVAYCTDLHAMPEDGFAALRGVKTMVIDCGNMFDGFYKIHANFDVVQKINERIECPDVILTHLKHSNADYKTTMARLPDGYRLAYDGLEISL